MALGWRDGLNLRSAWVASVLLAFPPGLSGCDQGQPPSSPPAGQPQSQPPQPKPEASQPAEPAAPAPVEKHKLKLSGKAFTLDVALDPQTRFKGLSNRDQIPADGGMLFVFPDRQVQKLHFVMRDCAVPIDIIFLDRSSRITAMHEMQPEPPRTADESVDDPAANQKYEDRLKRYSSEFDAQYVIELSGGTLKGLGLKAGQKLELGADALKKRAR